MLGQRLPAEWEPQDAILLLWPHKGVDGMQLTIVQLYEALVSVICDYTDVVIALSKTEIDNVRFRLEAMSIPLEHVYFYPVSYGDALSNLWARDCGPIAIESEQGLKLLSFTLNGCGEKVDANNVFKQLRLQNAFPAVCYEDQNWSLEAGVIGTDGQGTLLAKESYFLSKESSSNLSKDEIESRLKNAFGVSNILWLVSGSMCENCHYIDQLVRFCPNNTIVYTACDEEQDKYYKGLKKMEIELSFMKNAAGEPYRLLPLPWPGAMFNDEDERLQVSYASFLIVNEAVLVPIYNALSDEDALEVVFQAFPGFDIMGIPSETLVEQGGSLHRIAMQLPEGALGF
ncbi:MAG: agmatine deiminase family protein [Pseudomonadota bacterium]